jgi:predicted DNA-binding protein (MmcQ/YjbR family)
MHADEIREYCLGKKGVTECLPFDNDTLVFKVLDKMFLLLALEKKPLSMNVKCSPEKAIMLREEYPHHVLPGYHMNKIHWNTVVINEQLSEKLILNFIDESYALIVKSLPKSKQLLL